MSEEQAVEAAIRVWEQARKVEEDARKAVCEAKAALALANRALDDAEILEEDARREAARLMPPGVGEGRDYEQATGWVVDGRFYLKFSDEEVRSMGIGSIRIANPDSELPTPTGPDGHWTPCRVTCSGCGFMEFVYYRPLQFDYRLRCDRCGHTWRSGTIDERGGQR